MPDASTYIETSSLANALVNHKIVHKNEEELLGGLGQIMATATTKELPMNLETDTVGTEYYDAFSDNDTAGNTPSPLISRRSQTDLTLTDTPLVAKNGLASIQLGMYGRHTFLTDSTKKIKMGNIGSVMEKKMVYAAIADVGKLAFRTFDALGTTSATTGVADGNNTRCANAVANESLVIAEIAPADVKDMVSVFTDNNIAPVSGVVDIKNGFNLQSIRPSFVLYVHPRVGIDVIENFTGANEFVPVFEYASRGMTLLDPMNELGWIPKYNCRVVTSPFIKAQTGVAVNATAGMVQSGSVNVTYHNVLVGANAWLIPGLGKIVDVDVQMKSGTQERLKKSNGINFFTTPPVGGKSDPYKQIWTVGYTFWLGDKEVEAGARVASAGGMLIPNANSAGTVIYSAAKIITTASA
jgi:hypothetical protein